MLLLQNLVSAQLVSDARSAEELLSSAVVTLEEMSLEYCTRFSGESKVIRPDRSERLNSIRGHSVISREPEYTEFHSVAITQTYPESGSQERWYEALRFAEGSRNVFSSRRDLGLSKDALKARGRKKYQRLEAETDKANGKWPWTEADPLGFCVSSGTGMLNGRLSELSSYIKLYPNLKFLNSQVEENGDVTGKWTLQNGASLTEFKYRFGKKVNYLPVLIELRIEGDSVFSGAKNPGTTQIEWTARGKKLLPTKHTITYTSSSGDDTELILDWEWLPTETWHKHRIEFASELETDAETNFRSLIDQLIDQYNGSLEKSTTDK